jgi:hypothetical protein
MAKKPITPGTVFQAAQTPSAWLLSAERLSAAAEIIFCDQAAKEPAYAAAADSATQEAKAAAQAAADGTGHADIKCEEPNYVPGQMLYAFAIENALKGLAFVKHPNYANQSRLSRKLSTHNLTELAAEAGIVLTAEERPLLEKLSQLAEWAGRYPVALDLGRYRGNHPLGTVPESLLNWGAEHPKVRAFFTRAAEELRKALPKPPSRFGSIVAFK